MFDRNPSRSELLKFGASLFGLFALAGAVLWLNGAQPRAALGACGIGVGLGLVAIVPGVGRLLYVSWMSLGVGIGFIMTPALMLVLYVTLFTPVALMMRILRRDALQRQPKPQGESYWEDWKEPDDPKLYFKQY